MKKQTIEDKIKKLEAENTLYVEMLGIYQNKSRDSNMAFNSLFTGVAKSGDGVTIIRDMFTELTKYRIGEIKKEDKDE